MDVDLKNQIAEVATLEGHTDRVWNLAWNPKHPLLASCSADKTVRMYTYNRPSAAAEDGFARSAVSFKPTTTIYTEHLKTVRALAWAPSGETFATASFDSNVGVWAQEKDEDDEGQAALNADWECVGTLEGHETECKSVAFSCNGNLLATCSRDKSIWIWEVMSDGEFECVSVMLEHSQDVKCVAWHPQEEILASASYDDTIKLYVDDASDDWYCFTTLQGHASTVWSLAWSPDGLYLASASDDKTVRIWAYVEASSIEGEGDNRVVKVRAPSVMTSQKGEGRWIQVATIEAGERTMYSVSWTPNPKGKDKSLGWLAAAGSDGVLRIWDIAESDTVSLNYTLIASHKDAHGVHDINCVSWCPRKGHETVLATSGDDNCVRVWNVFESEV
ncbi:WD40 repeat-like protein [Coprinopsis marcescibilis]|uniref:Probable cytosolic iron-sulfur protein assembly protein 1 n=1 Tax=Coprinopsis marcescibilis TaxID=230819 RepID=A0A5C3KXI4_COPMA|nr:WD40 repeat-like protein [Coprinopsis marcescibilis]